MPQVPGSLEEALDALEADHDFLQAGGVFTDDLIETWITYKRAQRGRRPPPPPPPLRVHPLLRHLTLTRGRGRRRRGWQGDVVEEPAVDPVPFAAEVQLPPLPAHGWADRAAGQASQQLLRRARAEGAGLQQNDRPIGDHDDLVLGDEGEEQRADRTGEPGARPRLGQEHRLDVLSRLETRLRPLAKRVSQRHFPRVAVRPVVLGRH